MVTIVAATTSAAKVSFLAASNHRLRADYSFGEVPITVWAPGLAGEETVAFQVPVRENPDVDVDAHWTNLLDTDPVQLSASVNTITFYAPVNLRIVKSATAAAVGVFAER